MDSINLYPHYFQKSRIFLYPLLGIKSFLEPFQTFLATENVDYEDCNIVAVFDTKHKQWDRFKINMFNHEQYVDAYYEDQFIIVLFNLKRFKDDYRHFLRGEYSMFKPESKGLIQRYYGHTSKNWKLIESYLYPDKFFDKYSELLNCRKELLIENKELCDIYNKEREWLQKKQVLV